MNVNRRFLLLGVLGVLIVGIPVAWYLVSPLFVNKTVEEGFPTGQPPSVITVVPAEATAAMEEAMVEPAKEMSEPMPAGDAAAMTILARGEFYDVAHEGQGQAAVYELADGSRILRLDNFEVLNGPELHVYLVPIDPVPNTVGVEIAGSVDLGLLKGNVGSQNYDLPAGLDPSSFKSVVIWCRPFRVPFIAAPLAQGQ